MDDAQDKAKAGTPEGEPPKAEATAPSEAAAPAAPEAAKAEPAKDGPSETAGAAEASAESAAKVETYSADRRALVHAGALVFAVPLTWLAEWQGGWAGQASAAGGCLVLVLFNLFALHRIFPSIRRTESGANHGVWLYPLALGVGFLVFPPYAVGAAWAVLAAGDAAASVCGRRVPKPALPWNPKKSWVGMLAFLLAGVPTAALLLWWCPVPEFLTSGGSPEWPYVWTLAALGAVCGAILESLDGPFDDNLRVGLGVGLAVWLIAAFLNLSTSGMPSARAFQPEWLIHALIANAILVAVLLAFRFVDVAGAIAGGVIGTLVYFYTLWPGYLLMVFFVGVGSVVTRVGRTKKEQRNAAEAGGGKRGIRNVIANLIVPACCALGYAASKGNAAMLWAYAGALSAAMADTASSELGCLSTAQPRLITTRQPVPHGTNGGVSKVGYAAAVGAVLLFMAVGGFSGFWHIVLYGHGGGRWVAPLQGTLLSLSVFGAGMAGTTMDSYLGATVEDRIGGLNKHGVNFLCTLTGAVFAGTIGMVVG
jgi:uncharacterized protein (TIGR00297 family)